MVDPVVGGAMRKFGQLIIMLVAGFLCGAEIMTSPVLANGQSHSISSELREIVREIEKEASPSRRAELATQLALRTKQASAPQEVDDDAVLRITELLGHDDDAVRYEVAIALGNLGERSNMAVPALLKALRERECAGHPTQPYIQLSLTSADGIRTALEKIGSKVPAPLCGAK